jgi:small-conductance mechanosensitive channel
MCFNVRGIIQWFRNGRKKFEITRIARPISKAKLEDAIKNALEASAAATASAHENSISIAQGRIRELQTQLDTANHTICRTTNDYTNRARELQMQLDATNIAVTSSTDQIKELEKSLDTAKTATSSMTLEHEREMSRVCRSKAASELNMSSIPC